MVELVNAKKSFGASATLILRICSSVESLGVLRIDLNPLKLLPIPKFGGQVIAVFELSSTQASGVGSCPLAVRCRTIKTKKNSIFFMADDWFVVCNNRLFSLIHETQLVHRLF